MLQSMIIGDLAIAGAAIAAYVDVGFARPARQRP